MTITSMFIEEVKSGYEEELRKIQELELQAKNAGKALGKLIQDRINTLKIEVEFLSSNPSLIFKDTHKGRAIKEAIEAKLSAKSHEELVELSVQTSIDVMNLVALLDHSLDRKFTISQDFTASILKKVEGDKSRRKGKEDTFGEDNRRLEECLVLTKQKLGRDLIGSDYPAFLNILFSKYPKPLFTPSPRLTPEEKCQTEEKILLTIKSKMDDNWKDQRLRAFFERLTECKPTTKKVSSLR